MKRPSYQWYPGDWKRDTALQACSWEARALWRDLLDLMHDGQPYGHLCINGHALPIERVAAMVGLPVHRVGRYLTELHHAGVPSLTPEGTIYSRRMVRDEHIRTVRAEAGKLGAAAAHPATPVAPVLPRQNDGQAGGQSDPPAVAVAFASALNDDDSARAGALSAPMDPAGSSALQGYLRASHDPGRLLSELEAIVSGLHGPGGMPVPAEALGRALHAMQMVGVNKLSPKVLLGFCRREIEPDPEPKSGYPVKPESDLSAWVREREERERQRR